LLVQVGAVGLVDLDGKHDASYLSVMLMIGQGVG
jgi:hypothetical protein